MTLRSWPIVFSLAWAAVLVLIFGRWLALLLGANQSNLIEQAYTYSEVVLRPFFGIAGLSNQQRDGSGVFEAASAIGFAVYFATGALVLALARGARAAQPGRTSTPLGSAAPPLSELPRGELPAEVAESKPVEPVA